MSGYTYRPITDTWLLARTKSHYYGGYPEGFLWRARTLVPGRGPEQMIHLCSGKIDEDFTVDINPAMNPTLVADARHTGLPSESFIGCLIDPPYNEEEAKVYGYEYPTPRDLLLEGDRLLKTGGRVGILHFEVPRPPVKHLRLLALITVVVGFGNRVRAFTVFEKQGEAL